MSSWFTTGKCKTSSFPLTLMRSIDFEILLTCSIQLDYLENPRGASTYQNAQLKSSIIFTFYRIYLFLVV